MSFDAQSARALSRRVHSVHDCLYVMKQSIVQAAQAGEFEVTVALSESLPVVAGQSSNTAVFVVDFLTRNDRQAWAEAATQAVRAGYAVRPSWGRMACGAALEGLALDWRSASDEELAGATAPASLLMPASAARAMSEAEQTHVRWVESKRLAIQRAAQQGKLSVALDDATPAAAAAWSKRCEILQRAGFATELIASTTGTTLVVRW